MPRVKKECRICGKKYEACSTPNPNLVFRWRDVACCEEHGREWLVRVAESRKQEAEKQ